MVGTKQGAQHTATILKNKYGADYFSRLGRKGAIKALEKNPARLSEMGRIKGRKKGGAESVYNGYRHEKGVDARLIKEYEEVFDSRIFDRLVIKDRKITFIEIKMPKAKLSTR